MLRFASVEADAGKPASLTLLLPWTARRGEGAFSYGVGRRGGGGLLKCLWLGDDDDFKKECGELISIQDVECSDPGGKHKSKLKYYHYERCDFVFWLDKDGEKIKPLVQLTNDGPGGKPYTKGGVTITPLKQPLASQPVGDDEKRSGHLRIFYVNGCKNCKVVQYAKTTRTFKPPADNPSAKMPEDVPDEWHLDSADPYPGANKNDEGDTVIGDIPAGYESEIAKAADVKKMPKGGTVTYKWSLETFIYCDGKLFAWIEWGASVTFTMGDGGKLTPGAPAVDPPKFHGPDEYSQSKGNPKPP
jgi:hypothetical protein